MRGIMFAGIAITLIILSVKSSSAQQTTDTGCLRRISSCLRVASHPMGCCPTFEKEIINERECFCLMKDAVLTDREVAAGMAKILALCGFTQSFLTICSGTGSSSSSPPSMPSTPSPPSPTLTPAEISTSPPPAGPPLNTTPTVPMTLPPSATPGPPLDTTPTVPMTLPPSATPDPSSVPTSSPPKISISPTPAVVKPSSPPENGTANCFERIASCLKGASHMMECCQTLVDVIEFEKDCLCPQKDVFLQNPKSASSIATFLSTCNVPDSLENICSGTGSPSLNPPPTVPMTLPPSASRDKINSTSNNGTASASTSGSTKKIAYSVGLLPSLLLIIWATLV